ncbi:ATP-binding protein [Streptomyces sp. CAU 1734]|uniref:ATP-binding protein n=1 Tax=Streptomyces sp. CAU 1734 TaxID=3140360 RepID=UPI0032600C2D
MNAPQTPTHTPTPAQAAVRSFTQRFSATRRGSRLARLIAGQWLIAWDHPRGTPLFDTVALVVAELTSNAVLHGRVPGMDFVLRLVRDDERGVIRVEVSDAHPGLPARVAPRPDEDHGRGMLLVDALAASWGVRDGAGSGKTVWAECAQPGIPRSVKPLP